jgi:ubiquinone/menaquinone biosynthesis C-methylase UbiE
MTGLNSNTEWKQWGMDDPLWAVASWQGKHKGGETPWTEGEFYALGESDWRDFYNHWMQYGLVAQSCIEIGCGAGRITKQLASCFQRVYAIDVSEEMISRAREGISAKNVEFSVTDGIHLPQASGSVTAVFSTHVLQHLDNVDVGLSYFREFYRVLSTGGTMMIHLPLYELPCDSGRLEILIRWIYAATRGISDLRANLKRRTGVKMMRSTPYPIQKLRRFMSDIGFRNVEFRIFSLKSNGDPHPFVLATKG